MELMKTQLKQLKLAGVINTLEVRNEYAVKSNLSYLEFLELLIEDEMNSRRNNSFKKMLYNAHFPYKKTLEEFDWTFQPQINKKQIYNFAAGEFVRKKENIVFIGPPGVGKTHLSVAIGMKILNQGYKVLFTTVHEMMSNLVASKADNTYFKKMRYYLLPDLLILDELGYKKISQSCVDDFFEIISRRYEQGAIIITSNKSFKEWGEMFLDNALAGALIDRLAHHCNVVTITGESYRMKDIKLKKMKLKNKH